METLNHSSASASVNAVSFIRFAPFVFNRASNFLLRSTRSTAWKHCSVLSFNMSLTLSLTAQTSPFLDHPYRSYCNTLSAPPDHAEHVQARRSLSAATPLTSSSLKAREPARTVNENEIPRQCHSSIDIAQSCAFLPRPVLRQTTTSSSRQRYHSSLSAGVEAHTTLARESHVTISSEDSVESANDFADFSDSAEHDASVPEQPTTVAAEEEETSQKPTEAVLSAQPHSMESLLDTDLQPPFRRWLSKLRRRALSEVSKGSTFRTMLQNYTDSSGHNIMFPANAKQSHCRHSRSQSSSQAFVTAVRSGTVTLAESSLPPTSWLENRLSHLRNSHTSRSAHGSDDETNLLLGQTVDEAAKSRAVQRRKILEELIESEESYVGDLKVLTNVRRHALD